MGALLQKVVGVTALYNPLIASRDKLRESVLPTVIENHAVLLHQRSFLSDGHLDATATAAALLHLGLDDIWDLSRTNHAALPLLGRIGSSVTSVVLTVLSLVGALELGGSLLDGSFDQ